MFIPEINPNGKLFVEYRKPESMMSTEHMNPDDDGPVVVSDQSFTLEHAMKRIKELGGLPRPQHRYAVYRIGVDRLMDAVHILMAPKGATLAYTVRWTKCPWPEGARCVNIREDFYSRSFLLTMEHESFDEVPEGMPFPILNDPGYPECEIVELKPKAE